MLPPSNELLIRYWFKSKRNFGVGITAYSKEDADQILSKAIKYYDLDVDIYDVVTNVNIQDLDQLHIIPNMNPPIFRGVWFPMLNENLEKYNWQNPL